jgi:glucose 1-dehydrogenase
MELENQVAIITGAGSGIGRSIAMRFAREGADIVIVYSRNDANAKESAYLIEALGQRALVCKADASLPQAMADVVEHAVKTFGRIDCLVNNAGTWLVSPIFDMTEEMWNNAINVDLKATFVCSQAVARYWRSANRSGRIINIGSVHGTRSFQGLAGYASAKTGLIGLTRVLALELAPYQVNVNLVSPGVIAVGANREKNLDPEYALIVKQEVPLGRMGEGDEVANLVLFLAGDESNYITGAEIVIDGGLLLRPFCV